MGYSRYYETNKVGKYSSDFVEDVKKIVALARERHGVVIKSWNGENEPVITDELISLNGDAKNNEDCETFIMDATRGKQEFCKTRGKPYDMVVKAILTIARSYGYVKNISSDGPNDTDKQANKICIEVAKERDTKNG